MLTNNKLYLLLVMLVAFILNIGCGKKKEENGSDAEAGEMFVSHEIATFDQIAGLNSAQLIVPVELRNNFCKLVLKLPLKSDFSKEVGYLCQDNVPTPTFDQFERLAQLVGSTPRAIKLHTSHNGNETHAIFGTAIHVPMEPKWVRNEPIQGFMTTDSKYDYVALEGQVTADLEQELGGDLQFSKYNLNYKTDIDTQDGGRILNDRNTQFNSYQVQGGNPDIGFGGEHLSDANNPDFKIYNTITVTIADGNRGSLMFSIVQVLVDNRGYPQLTEKSISDIAAAQATHILRGVTLSAKEKGE